MIVWYTSTTVSLKLNLLYEYSDFISKLPASNSGAQMLTQHIFNSPHSSAMAPGKYDKTVSYDGKGKGEIGLQGDDKGRKKKKVRYVVRLDQKFDFIFHSYIPKF